MKSQICTKIKWLAKILLLQHWTLDLAYLNNMLVVVATFLLLLAPTYNAASGLPSNTSAAFRAQQTLNGLFNYYWKHDSTHSKVQFIFVCAQIGTPAAPGKCTCTHPKPCLDCYRWWSAVALESVATYGIYTNSTNHSAVPDMFYTHSPYNADWNATAACTYIDDFTWYGIAYLRVYEWLKVSKGVGLLPNLRKLV